MFRLECQGLTLRLFATSKEALSSPEVCTAHHYDCGWLTKDSHGKWADAHGVLPLEWAPKPSLLGPAVTSV